MSMHNITVHGLDKVTSLRSETISKFVIVSEISKYNSVGNVNSYSDRYSELLKR
jgi:hypothetical protein